MRRVFTNYAIPHLWAHEVQGEARNRYETLWFEGDTIYSYRAPIGRIAQQLKA